MYQFDQRVAQHDQTHSLLEEKRNECLRKQSEMHLLEEKFNASTMAIHDKITRELNVSTLFCKLNVREKLK